MRRSVFLLLRITFLLVGVAHGWAGAATFTVTTTADTNNVNPSVCADPDGNCSLRGAIQAANVSGTPTDILVPAGSYDLTQGMPLAVTGTVNIHGENTFTTIINGKEVVVFLCPSNSVMGLDNVTVTNGRSSSGSGGGIQNFGTMTITNSQITGNRADGGAGGGISNSGPAAVLSMANTVLTNNIAAFGGAIVTDNGSTLVITDSTIDSNTATLSVGGGVYVAGATVTLKTSTFSNNQALGGGGLFVDAFAGRATVVNIVNSTFSGNMADIFAGGIGVAQDVNASLSNVGIALNRVTNGFGGGIAAAGSGLNIQNSYIAGNQASDGSDCVGQAKSSGYILIQDPTNCQFTGDITTLILEQDPGLGPLQNNGGPTPTLLPNSGSLVIGAGNPAGCTDLLTGAPLDTDQRGQPRPGTGMSICSIGPVERQPSDP